MHSNNLLQKLPPNIVQLTAIACRAGNDARGSKDGIEGYQIANPLNFIRQFLRLKLLTRSLAHCYLCPRLHAISYTLIFW